MIEKLLGKGKDNTGQPSAKGTGDSSSRSKAEMEQDVRAAVKDAEGLMARKTVSKENLEGKFPSIIRRRKIKELRLKPAGKKGHYVPYASVNPESTGDSPQLVLSNTQIASLKALASKFAQYIGSNPARRAKYSRDKKSFLENDVKTGDIVEFAALPLIEQFAAESKMKLIYSPTLKLIGGEPQRVIGGDRAELDFLLVGDKSKVTIISAKLDAGKFKVKQDKTLLSHFLNIPATAPDIVTYAETYFGRNKEYKNVYGAVVDSSVGRKDIETFRKTYLSKVSVSDVEVKSVAPRPNLRGIQIEASKEELLDLVIEMIDQVL
ncbi:hypothetical protein [Deinococcus multiflagellatus]|uniref:Uncharacterized protein n=1 Tax=Deinococcus multiflagellatus TaxID=1656887 RepID=A0ABW1ZR29_9DEIO